MPARRGSALQIAITPNGMRQADLATIIPAANFTLLFPDTAKNFYSFEQTFEDVLNCSGEELYAKLLTGEIGNLTITFDVTASLLAPVTAYGLGVAAAPTGTTPKIHAITELPVGEYQVPWFGIVVNFAGQTDAVILRGCVTESFSIKAAARGKVSCDWVIRFVAAEPLEDFVFPLCVMEMPLRFADCELTKGVVNLSTSNILRSFEYTFSNAIITDDFAYTGSGVNPSRLERADRRARTLNYQVLGDNLDALYTAARPGNIDNYLLRVGTALLGVDYELPTAFTTLNGTGIVKDGSAAETNISLTAEATERTEATAHNTQTTAYLLTA